MLGPIEHHTVLYGALFQYMLYRAPFQHMLNRAYNLFDNSVVRYDVIVITSQKNISEYLQQYFDPDLEKRTNGYLKSRNMLIKMILGP